jgi:hypothetical protein
MRVVEIFPREESTVTAIDHDVQSYFNGKVSILRCSFAGKDYSFVCYEDGIQVKNNEVKALYGPAIVCNAQLKELSEEEAQTVKHYVNNNQFELDNLMVH